MTATELKDAIITALKEKSVHGWLVTVDEAQMMNINADTIDEYFGFIYVEEFDTMSTSFAQFGLTETTRHDVYFCRFADLDSTAKQREYIRDNQIRPVVRLVERYLELNHNVMSFASDKFPRGFDANEVLIHINFQTADRVC